MIEIRDKRGGLTPVKLYKFEDDGDDCFDKNNYKDDDTGPEYKVKVDERKGNGEKLSTSGRWFYNVVSFFGGIFLPSGYSATVSKDYMGYQICDTIQNMASSVARPFAAEAVFKSLGVGDSSATVLAAAMTTLVRDGSKWSGEIFLAWVKGSAFGYHNKKWRLVADFRTDVVLTFELFSPLFPPWTVIYVLAISSFLSGCGTTAGRSAKTTVALHQAKAGNIADVSAKDNSQERAVNFLGMIVSLVILPLVSGRYVLVRIVFGICVFIHLVMNYLGVRAIRFTTLNEARLLICLKQYFRDKSIPPIRKSNLNESYIIGFGHSAKDICGMNIKMGVGIKRAFKIKARSKTTPFDVPSLLEEYEGKRFIILPNAKAGRVDVVLEESIWSVEIIEAYFRAVYCAHRIKTCMEGNKDAMNEDVEAEWINFKANLQSQGYDLSGFLMKFGEHKAWWTTEPKSVKVL